MIDSNPASLVVTEGDPASFTVSAHGPGTLTRQWYKNNTAITGATDWTLSFTATTKADIGGYALEVTNGNGSVRSEPAFLSVLSQSPAPVIVIPPQSITQPEGASVTFTVETLGVTLGARTAAASANTYQWYKNDVAIDGAIGTSYTVNNITGADAGVYTVVVSNGAESVTSRPARLTVADPVPGKIRNLSVRSINRSTGTPLIVGFVTQGGPKSYLIRGAGPSLSAFEVTNFMADPALDLHGNLGSGDAILATNDNWGDGGLAETLTAAFGNYGAFAFASTSSKDAAFEVSVDGQRTVHVRSASGDPTGVILVEAYDKGTGLTPRLINVSARHYAGAGAETLIAGFVIDGNVPKKILVRGVGPGLAQFGLTGLLQNPKIEVFLSADGVNTLQATNDTWSEEAAAPAAIAAAGAFTLPANSADAAAVVVLPGGVYSAVVTAPAGDTGEALVEVYEVP